MEDDPTVRPGGQDDATRASDAASRAAAMKATALPARIGNYRIVRLIGEGGMGSVYEAEQDNPRRTVALKVIRSGHLSAAMLRRFEHESEVLGRLQHPGIAQIHEAGTVEDAYGQRLPFFAMELIRGEELDTYAKTHSLGTRARLELLARICDAVSHAHQKGVIHRDLKPGNILVDETGQPKILDFGVARATDSDLQRTTMRTDIGELIGTIPYMSPEQVSGDPTQLDTRSDVYALGVIAYELLAGRMPYDLQQRMIHDALRVIREEEPTRLSRIDRTLRGDVETIVGKALEKDKTRRYASAEALAADIRRHLSHEPIAARPASTWYQVAKFARRNKGLVLGLTIAMLLLVLGLIGTALGLREALVAGKREEDARIAAQASEAAAMTARADEQKHRERAERDRKRAEIDRDKSKVIAEFMSNVFRAIDQMTALGRDTELIEAMMDGAAERIENGELAGSPEAEVYLRNSIGPMYTAISKPEVARRLLEPALVKLRERDRETLELAHCMNNLAGALHQCGDLRGAFDLQTEAAEVWRRVDPADSRDFAQCLSLLGRTAMAVGDVARAEAAANSAIEMFRRLGGDDDWKLASALEDLGTTLLRKGDRDGSEKVLRQVLDMKQRLFPDDHTEMASIKSVLGEVLQAKGEVEAAEKLMREALTIHKRIRRGDHELVAGAMSNLSGVLVARRELEEAETLARDSLAMYRRLLPGDHPRTAVQINNMGHLLQQKGDLDGAEPFFRDGLAMLQRVLPADHPNLVPLVHNLACLLQAKKDFAAAEPLFRDAIARMQQLFPAGHPNTALCLFNLAKNLRDSGDLEQAEVVFREALAMRRACHPNGHFSIAQSLEALGALLQQRGDAAGGEALLEEARELRERIGAKRR